MYNGSSIYLLLESSRRAPQQYGKTPSPAKSDKLCWGPRHLTEDEAYYDLEYDELCWSREARGIAYSWIQEQGLEIYFHKGRQSPIFIRPFDPKHDTLYVPPNKWSDFMCEPFDRHFEPDLEHRILTLNGTDLARIAVPEALLQNQVDPLADFFDNYYGLEKLFIVVNPPPDLQPEDNDTEVQRRWELENTRGATFFWNTDCGGFEWRDGEDIGDKALYKLIVDASNGLVEKFRNCTHVNFEVRPVLAVRR